VRRGDLHTVAGGVYASKPRPALVIQDDAFDATDSVIVIPLTSTAVDAPLLRVPIAAAATTGLELDSYAMVDKITAVRRSNVHGRVGTVSSESMVAVERSMAAFLGLAR
jgi:mRNA interferase MazF